MDKKLEMKTSLLNKHHESSTHCKQPVILILQKRFAARYADELCAVLFYKIVMILRPIQAYTLVDWISKRIQWQLEHSAHTLPIRCPRTWGTQGICPARSVPDNSCVSPIIYIDVAHYP